MSLTKQQEIELYEKWTAHKDVLARDTLLESAKRLIWSHSKGRVAAYDFSQKCWLRVVSSLDSYNPSKARFRSWVVWQIRSVNNLQYRTIYRAKREGVTVSMDAPLSQHGPHPSTLHDLVAKLDSTDPEEMLSAKQELVRRYWALEEKYRPALLLVLQGHTLDQAARATKVCNTTLGVKLQGVR